MRWCIWFVLISSLFVGGCGSGGGAVGDQQDPEVSGSDEHQSNEKDGDVIVGSNR